MADFSRYPIRIRVFSWFYWIFFGIFLSFSGVFSLKSDQNPDIFLNLLNDFKDPCSFLVNFLWYPVRIRIFFWFYWIFFLNIPVRFWYIFFDIRSEPRYFFEFTEYFKRSLFFSGVFSMMPDQNPDIFLILLNIFFKYSCPFLVYFLWYPIRTQIFFWIYWIF